MLQQEDDRNMRFKKWRVEGRRCSRGMSEGRRWRRRMPGQKILDEQEMEVMRQEAAEGYEAGDGQEAGGRTCRRRRLGEACDRWVAT